MNDNVVEERFRLTGEESFLQGHFPGFPIMPGVVQLGFACRCARKMLGRDAAPKCVKKMKFSALIRPGEDVLMRVERRGDGEFAYEFRKGDEVCSSGLLLF